MKFYTPQKAEGKGGSTKEQALLMKKIVVPPSLEELF